MYLEKCMHAGKTTTATKMQTQPIHRLGQQKRGDRLSGIITRITQDLQEQHNKRRKEGMPVSVCVLQAKRCLHQTCCAFADSQAVHCVSMCFSPLLMLCYVLLSSCPSLSSSTPSPASSLRFSQHGILITGANA